MANKQVYDKRSQSRQNARTTNGGHIYRQSLPTAFLVARFLDYLARISVSDWNAALPDEPFTCSGEAWRSNGLGAVVDWPKPAKLVIEAPRPEALMLAAGAQTAVDRRAA